MLSRIFNCFGSKHDTVDQPQSPSLRVVQAETHSSQSADRRTFSPAEIAQLTTLRNTLTRHHPNIIHQSELQSASQQYDQLVDDVAHCLQRDLQTLYPHEPAVPDHFNTATRYTVADLRGNGPSQSAWVHHVFGLLRLRSVVSKNAIAKLQNAISQGLSRNEMTELQSALNALEGLSIADAVLQLYLSEKRQHARGSAHNTHPSSIALKTMTGLVYHPRNNLLNSSEHHLPLPTPLVNTHPGSFEKFPFILLDRYTRALETDSLKDFFDSAFIRQRPCYEDVQQNVLNYGTPEVTDHPQPDWQQSESLEANLTGQFAWAQRQYLKLKLQREGRSLTQLSATELDAIESSAAFAVELREHCDLLWRLLQAVVPHPHHTASQGWLTEMLESQVGMDDAHAWLRGTTVNATPTREGT